jgi:glycosyltransferase involved in cell wall biosynthesis
MAPAAKIPVSAVIVTRNEERRIRKCLMALKDFSEIVVVDSQSADRTKEIAKECGAKVFDFAWNGLYPKKRQWTLDNIAFESDFIFWIDADEICPQDLAEEMKNLDPNVAGYFVQGIYIFEGAALNHGLRNNKLALMNKRKMEFPIVDDIGAPGMGEIEGHYQPVLKKGFESAKIGQLKNFLLHDAYGDKAGWTARHERYAAWETEMDKRKAWPEEPKAFRKILKTIFKSSPLRPHAAFTHSYILKFGFLDGARGFRFAQSRYAYYRMISGASKRAA